MLSGLASHFDTLMKVLTYILYLGKYLLVMEDQFQAICTNLVARKWAVLPTFIDAALAAQLINDSHRKFHQGEFHPAGIGKKGEPAPNIRGDSICWWAPEHLSAPQKVMYDKLE